MKNLFLKFVGVVFLLFGSTLNAAEDGIMFRGRLFQWVNPFPEDMDIPAEVDLRHGTFLSPSMEHEVGYVIYLPPQYEANPGEQFPVVYYLHGGRPGGEHRGLSIVPQIHQVMTNGDAPPMVYVFVNGGVISHYNYPAKNQILLRYRVVQIFVHALRR